VKVTVFAWGNPSRGDDAVGPWFAERFRGETPETVSLVEAFQLQVEHLLDCRAGDLLLFVDAGCEASAGFRFEAVPAMRAPSHTSHALAPAELLSYYPRVFPGESPPPAFQLTVYGHQFGLGQPMSPITLQCCLQAATLVERLLRRPDYRFWQEHIEQHSEEGIGLGGA
jgi:hydrogenase maturation protease